MNTISNIRPNMASVMWPAHLPTNPVHHVWLDGSTSFIKDAASLSRQCVSISTRDWNLVASSRASSNKSSYCEIKKVLIILCGKNVTSIMAELQSWSLRCDSTIPRKRVESDDAPRDFSSSTKSWNLLSSTFIDAADETVFVMKEESIRVCKCSGTRSSLYVSLSHCVSRDCSWTSSLDLCNVRFCGTSDVSVLSRFPSEVGLQKVSPWSCWCWLLTKACGWVAELFSVTASLLKYNALVESPSDTSQEALTSPARSTTLSSGVEPVASRIASWKKSQENMSQSRSRKRFCHWLCRSVATLLYLVVFIILPTVTPWEYGKWFCINVKYTFDIKSDGVERRTIKRFC